MGPDFPMLIKAALLVAGLIWLRAAFRQLPEEIRVFRTTETPGQRAGQIVAWVISGAILLGTGWFILSLVMTFVRGVSS